jgi:hypothetical protein
VFSHSDPNDGSLGIFTALAMHAPQMEKVSVLSFVQLISILVKIDAFRVHIFL